MNIATIKGRGASEEAESIFVHVFNGTGAEVAVGTPLCYDVVSSDGKTGTTPTSGTNSSNFAMFAGLAQAAIGTGAYSGAVQAHGVASARVYGIATTLVPGSYLALIATENYVHYGSAGMFAGSSAVAQPICMTALATNATVDTTQQLIYIKGVV